MRDPALYAAERVMNRWRLTYAGEDLGFPLFATRKAALEMAVRNREAVALR